MTIEEAVMRAGTVATAISAVLGLIVLVFSKPLKKRRKKDEAEALFRKEVLEKLGAINDDIGDLQYERLSQSHDFYVGRGWCPTSKKQQLCLMYKSYTDKGRNHLSKRYEEELLALPDSPLDR